MTICRDTIPYIAASVIELEERGLLFTANIVFEDIWGASEERIKLLNIYEDQLSELVDFYFSHPELIPASLVDRKIEYIVDQQKKLNKLNKNVTRFCGAGEEMVAFDVNGEQYPCHRFIPCFNNNHETPREPVNQRSEWKPEICPTCVPKSTA